MDEYTPVSVEGKTAVVIGGTSGIGRSIALGFAEDGADVVASSRGEEAVSETAAELRDRGADTIERTCDVTDAGSIAALREETEAALGEVDALVLSAGAVNRETVTEVSEAEWDRVLDVQLDGVRRAIAEFAPEMDGGSIVTISSMTATLGLPNLAAYTAAKGGVEALTRAAAKELGPDVRVNAIAPGFFVTELNRETYAEGTERRERIDERTAMGRVGETEELIGAAIYLASDAAAYTTGDVLTVDGGFASSAF
jgi:NAD(P)-dependent dehydrogenase (short-subunit alcohol dehydrogenase family)